MPVIGVRIVPDAQDQETSPAELFMRVFIVVLMFLAAACSETVAPDVDPPRTINWETLYCLRARSNSLISSMKSFSQSSIPGCNLNNPKVCSTRPRRAATATSQKDRRSTTCLNSARLTSLMILTVLGCAFRVSSRRLNIRSPAKLRNFCSCHFLAPVFHTPPPPPNQIVYVTAEKPQDLGNQWDAIWVVGILRTQRNMNDLGNAAYTLEIESWEAYEI